MYNIWDKKVGRSFLGFYYARENSKRLLCGFFFMNDRIKADLEAKMAMTEQNSQRKGSRRQSNRGNNDKRIIKIEGAEDKEQTVTVHHATAREKGKSTWNWHEEFVLEWSETLITERKKSPK